MIEKKISLIFCRDLEWVVLVWILILFFILKFIFMYIFYILGVFCCLIVKIIIFILLIVFYYESICENLILFYMLYIINGVMLIFLKMFLDVIILGDVIFGNVFCKLFCIEINLLGKW